MEVFLIFEIVINKRSNTLLKDAKFRFCDWQTFVYKRFIGKCIFKMSFCRSLDICCYIVLCKNGNLHSCISKYTFCHFNNLLGCL